MEIYRSKLSESQLLTKLKQNSNTNVLAWLFGSKRIMGFFYGRKFILNARFYHASPRSAQYLFFGKVFEDPDGARIEGEYKLAPGTMLLFNIIFVLAFLFVIGMLVMMLVTGLAFRDHGMPLVFLTLFSAILFISFKFQKSTMLLYGMDTYPFVIEYLEYCAKNETSPLPEFKRWNKVIPTIKAFIDKRDDDSNPRD